MPEQRILGTIEFELHGRTLRADLTREGWLCADVQAEALLYLHANPQGQPMSQPAFRLATLQQGAQAMGGRVIRKPRFRPLPPGVIG